jgi:hypothetical protein
MGIYKFNLVWITKAFKCNMGIYKPSSKPLLEPSKERVRKDGSG